MPRYQGEEVSIVAGHVQASRSIGSACENKPAPPKRDGIIHIGCWLAVYELYVSQMQTLVGSDPSDRLFHIIRHSMDEDYSAVWAIGRLADGRIWVLDEGEMVDGRACFEHEPDSWVSTVLRKSGLEIIDNQICLLQK